MARHLRVIHLQDPLLAYLAVVAAGLVLVMSGALAVAIRPTDQQVILHYSVYFGIDLIDAWYAVYLVPAIGTFIWLLNTTLATWWYRQERVVSFLLVGATALFEVILSVAVGLIIWVNY